MTNVGRWVRLWGIHNTELPLGSASATQFLPLLKAILGEARVFTADVPPSSPASLWKPKGTKRFPDSNAPVDLFERIVSASELQAVAKEHAIPEIDAAKVKSESWALRRSVHKDAAETGTASWDEWVTTFKDNHAETEKEFTPTVLSTNLLQTWDCSGVEMEVDGIVWTDWTLKLEESVHKLPFPLKSRLFRVFQITCSARDSREVMIVQLAVRDGEAESKEKEHIWGAYTSVERFKETEGNVEWIMGTASDARGILPPWLQRLSVAGVVAKDVQLFLKWIPSKRGRVGQEQ